MHRHHGVSGALDIVRDATRTRWPRCRRIRAHLVAATRCRCVKSVPRCDKDDLHRTTAMPVGRPAGASAGDLVAQLRETRLRTRRLTEDLSWAELMARAWTIVKSCALGDRACRLVPRVLDLAPAHGEAPLIERGDRLWDSSSTCRTPRAGSSICLIAPAHSATWPTSWCARRNGWEAPSMTRRAISTSSPFVTRTCMSSTDLLASDARLCRRRASWATPGIRRQAPAGRCRRAGRDVAPGIDRRGCFIFDNEKWRTRRRWRRSTSPARR